MGPSAIPPSPDSRRRKRCRGFFNRTLDCVQTASKAWGYIFKVPAPQFTWVDSPSLTCADLAKAVKSFLASDPFAGEVLPPLCGSEPSRMAFQSIKKMLPDSCRCMESGLISSLADNLTTPSPPLPAGYLEFVSREVSRLFPKAWDSSYEGFCRRTSPPLSAVVSPSSKCSSAGSRSSGGCLAAFTGHDQVGQADFLETTLFGRSDHYPDAKLRGEAIVVQSAGKPRPLTKFEHTSLFLKPLHKAIYSHMSKKVWLLRGDLTQHALNRAGFSEVHGEVLTSGDYASATDNLPIEVMERALETLLGNASCVPPNIKLRALAACRPILRFEDEELVIKKGQMMGSYLSFPFLCLQNYLAFRWSTRGLGRIPVLINGDDILFRSTPAASERWMRTVGALGLQVERTKTSVSSWFGTLNSTLVGWKDGALIVKPTLRFGMLRPSEYLNNLGKSFSDFLLGTSGSYRWRAGQVFFDFHYGEMKKSSWSLPSMGFRGTLAVRLAQRYKLLASWRLTGDMPRSPDAHSVVLSLDQVSEVPIEFASEEVMAVSADETSAWKWSTGWRPVNREKNALRWAIDSTCWTTDTDIVSSIIDSMALSDRCFKYRFSGQGRLSQVEGTRSSLRKAFLRERSRLPVKRVFKSVADEMVFRASSFGCPLPSYEDSSLDRRVEERIEVVAPV